MAKQSLGWRPATTASARHHGHICTNRRSDGPYKFMDFVAFNQRPAGQNFVVAVILITLPHGRCSIHNHSANSAVLALHLHAVRTARGAPVPRGQEDHFETPRPTCAPVPTRRTTTCPKRTPNIPGYPVSGGTSWDARPPPRIVEEEEANFLTGHKRRETSSPSAP